MRSPESLLLEKIIRQGRYVWLFCWNGEGADESWDCACCITWPSVELWSRCECPCHVRFERMAQHPDIILWLRGIMAGRVVPEIPENYERALEIAKIDTQGHDEECGCDDCMFVFRALKQQKHQPPEGS